MSREQYLVSDAGGGTWTTYRRCANGSLQRVKSPHLPLRATREQAEHDLAVWLAERAPVTRQDRARRAARLWKQAMNCLARSKTIRDAEYECAQVLAEDAWRELRMGVGEPAHPDQPFEVDACAIAKALGWPLDTDKVLAAYGQGRTKAGRTR